MKKITFLVVALSIVIGVAVAHAYEMPASKLADRLDSWFKEYGKGYKFRDYISPGDAQFFRNRLTKKPMKLYVGNEEVDRKKPGANIGFYLPGYLWQADAMYIRVNPSAAGGDTLFGLWHEAIHAILSLDDNAVFESHHYTEWCQPGDLYTYYIEGVLRDPLFLDYYEKEYNKGEACRQEMLDEYWKKFETKIEDVRRNKGASGCGIVDEQQQFDQMKNLLGFYVDPKTIQAGYKAIGMDKCAVAGITVSVKDADAPDKPIPGASVSIKGEKNCFGKTDDRGKLFCKAFVDGVSYEVKISADGYITHDTTASFKAAEKPGFLVLLHRAVGVAGTLVDYQKNPLAGVDVRLKGKENYDARTDIDGKFSFDGVSPGKYRAVAVVKGYYQSQSGEIVVGDQQTQKTISMVMKPILSTVVVRVSSGRAPVAGAKISIKKVGEQATDASGKTAFKGITPGDYSIDIQAAGCAEGKKDLTIAPESEDPAVVTVDVLLQPALTLKIEVLDAATGKSIPDVNVTLSGAGEAETGFPNGVGSLKGLAPGSYKIATRASGYAPYSGSVNVEMGKENAITVKMKAAARLTVRVVGWDTARKEEIRGLSNPYVKIDGNTEWQRGDRITFEDLGSGNHTAYAIADGYGQGRETMKVVPEKSDYAVVVRLVATKLPTLGVSVYGSDNRNTLLRAGRSAYLKGQKNSVDPIYSAGGGIYFHNLVPGTYTLSLSAEGYEPYSGAVEIGDSEKYIEITLKVKEDGSARKDKDGLLTSDQEKPVEIGNEAEKVMGAIAGFFGGIVKEVKKATEGIGQEQPAQQQSSSSNPLDSLSNLFKKKEKPKDVQQPPPSTPPPPQTQPQAPQQVAQAVKPAEVKQPEPAKPTPPNPPVKTQQERDAAKKQYDSCIRSEKESYDNALKEKAKVGQKDAWTFFRCGDIGTNWQMIPSKTCCDPFRRDSDKNMEAAAAALQRCGWDEEIAKRKANLDKRTAECASKYPLAK